MASRANRRFKLSEMKHFFKFYICAAILGNAIAQQCIVIAPRSLRSNSDYSLSLTTIGVEQSIKFRVQIYERSEQASNRTLDYTPNDRNLRSDLYDLVTLRGPKVELAYDKLPDGYSTDAERLTPVTFVRTKLVEVAPGNPKIVTFPIESGVTPGSYLLEVKSLSDALNFQRQTFLRVESNIETVHIQTDKALYRPGELVRYRVLIVDAATRPIKVTNDLFVSVYDIVGNQVHLLAGQSIEDGVFTGEFNLPESAPNGIWRIGVVHGDQKFRKSFEVDDYVAPRFQVSLSTRLAEHRLLVRLVARYVFGRNVHGLASIRVTPIVNGEPIVAQSEVAHHKINGELHVDLAIRDFKTVLVEATVREHGTGIERHAFDQTVQIERPKNGGARLEDSDRQRGIHLQLPENKPKLGDTVYVKFSCVEKMTTLFYYVVGRGNILLSKSIDLKNRQRENVLKFNSSPAMLPKSSLVVYYLDAGGRIVSNSIEIEFSQKNLPNPFSIQISDVDQERMVKLKVDTTAGSHVGLSLVDQSVVLAKRGNELTRTRIFSELELFDNAGDYDAPEGADSAYVNLLKPGTLVLSNVVNASSITRAVRRRPQFDYADDIVSDIVIPVLHVPRNHHDHHDHYDHHCEKQKPRKHFQEVAAWRSLKNSNAENYLEFRLPDTVSTWKLDGFSLHPTLGLGLPKNPLIVSTFQPFFVEVNLPPSAKDGDIIEIPIKVHNYLNHHAKVRLHIDFDEGSFETITPYQRHLYASADSVATVVLRVIPRRQGQLRFDVSAIAEHACDRISRKLLVKPKGVVVVERQTATFSVDEKKNFNTTIRLNVPENAVPGSVRVRLAVQGDKYSLDLENVGNSLAMASGTGEDYLNSYLSTAVQHLYLRRANKLTACINETTTNVAQQVANTLARYQCSDGGFTPIGDCDDPDRGTYLTARSVTSTLGSIGIVTNINVTMINKALDFLETTQLSDGSFAEFSREPPTNKFQNGTTVLTGFIMNCLMLPKLYGLVPNGHDVAVEKATSFLLKKMPDLDLLTLFSLALSLRIYNHPAKDTVDALITKQLERSRVSARLPPNIDQYFSAINYFILADRPGDGLPIVNGVVQKLVQSFNASNIGFIEIGAFFTIASFNERYRPANSEVKVQFSAGDWRQVEQINEINRFVWKTIDLPAGARQIQVYADGRGFASVEAIVEYNLPDQEVISKPFGLSWVVTRGQRLNDYNLEVCANFAGFEGQQKSNASLSLTLPAGFTTAEYVSDVDPKSKKIQRKRLENYGLEISFADLDVQKECFDVPLRRLVSTVQSSKGYIRIEDSSRKAIRNEIVYTI